MIVHTYIHIHVCRKKPLNSYIINVANKSCEDVANIRYMETLVTNKNCIHEKFVSRINSVIACYHAVQNLSFFHLLSLNVKIKTNEIIILLDNLYGFGTGSLTIKKNTDWGCLRTGCIREYLDLREMRNSVICILYQMSLGWSNQGGRDGRGI
jgi:hypothetical protein